MERNKEKVNSPGKTVQNMKEILKTIIFRVMVYIFGKMEGNILEIGKRTKCMAKDNLLGSMVRSTMVIMLMTKSKVSENLSGPTERSIEGSGKTANSMDKVASY